MDLPPLEHHVWHDIISGNNQCQFESLAVRILQSTLARAAAEDPSPENLQACVRMLRGLFAQNISSPSIQRDLEKICPPREMHES